MYKSRGKTRKNFKILKFHYSSWIISPKCEYIQIIVVSKIRKLSCLGHLKNDSISNIPKRKIVAIICRRFYFHSWNVHVFTIENVSYSNQKFDTFLARSPHKICKYFFCFIWNWNLSTNFTNEFCTEIPLYSAFTNWGLDVEWRERWWNKY